MPIESINSSNSAVKRNNKLSNQQSFTGSFNPVVTVMDTIDKGGFMASFIAQDGIGMVAPRIYEGLNRNRERDENGKKTGPLNWEFARREGIREILSGPSAYFIPLGLLTLIKKYSGSANNVHADHINTLGEHFAEYASKNPSQLADHKAFRTGYYTQVFENLLSNSTNGYLAGDELKSKAGHFAEEIVKIEELKKIKNKKEAKELTSKLVGEYIDIRKANSEASTNTASTVMKIGEKTLNSDIKRMIQSITDYTDDALEKTGKFVRKNKTGDIKEFIKKFNLHRIGTRTISNLGMWGSVVGFYMFIPKLYNLGLKYDPGLKGLENHTEDKKNENGNNQPSFTGGFSSVGERAVKGGKLTDILKRFEFNGAAMPITGMITLLFGFTLPTRYANAKSDKERKEILVRDITSFAAILFAAKALSRGFSDVFSKISGLALNTKPQDHSKSFLHKLKNYFTAGEGIDVLSSQQIVSKYSNLSGYKDGINGFFNFLKENGGDVKKVLNIDKTVKENAEKIMEKYGNKSLKDATFEEIQDAFKKAKTVTATELENIYTVFSAQDNKFINRAKTFNSAFGFASTLILVPAFMMWLARYCEKMTKKAVEKENAQRKTQENLQSKTSEVILTDKPTMAGFLNK
ncbi:hypothetical protein J6P92_05350 [bacterium]|nr:hypothetical protein [bacterium]